MKSIQKVRRDFINYLKDLGILDQYMMHAKDKKYHLTSAMHRMEYILDHNISWAEAAVSVRPEHIKKLFRKYPKELDNVSGGRMRESSISNSSYWSCIHLLWNEYYLTSSFPKIYTLHKNIKVL